MMEKGRAFIATLALALAACGGGSGQGGSSGTAPTPAPSPAPSPAPAPAPAFGFGAAFTRSTQVGVLVTEFRYLDPVTNTSLTRLLDAKLLDAASIATLTFQPEPQQASVTLGNETYAFSASNLTIPGDPRRYVRAERALVIALGGGQTTELGLTTFATPDIAATDGGQTGTTRQVLLAPIGNVSTVQTVIDGPVSYSATPVIIGGDIYSGASLAQVRSIGTGVTLGFNLIRNVNGAQQSAGAVTLRGTLDAATNRIAGDVVDGTAGAVIGSFTGALYGPNREQLGIAFRFLRSQDGGRLYAGYYIAPRT